MELGPITLDQSPLYTQIRVQNGGARMALLVRIGFPRHDRRISHIFTSCVRIT